MLEQFQKLSLQSQDYLLSQLSDSELPKDLLNMAPILKLDSLQISDFKSFGGNVYVGPFLGFTCLIGPNGSGKSNVLEAIMFCFCSENIKHSYFDLRDFIHRDGGGTQTFKELSQKGKRCKVSARLLLKDGNQLNLMRELDAESKEKYCINYETVSRKVYENFLLRKGINPNTPNYAIWQGEVDRLILKQPLQLTNCFEQLSGSIMLKHTYEEIKNAIDDTRKEIEYRTQRITKLKSQRRNMKTIKDNTHQYQKAEENYYKIIEKLLTAKVYLKQLELKQLEKEIDFTTDKETEKMKEINEHKVKLQRQQKQKINLEKEMNQIMSEINQLNAQLKIKNQPANILKQHKIHELRNQIIALENAVKDRKQRRQVLENSIPEIHSTDLTKEYLDLYTQWQNENTASNQELHKKKTQLLYVEGLLQAKEAIVYEYQAKQENEQKHQEESKKQAQHLKQQIQSIDGSVIKMRLELSKANELMKKGQKQLMEKRVKLSQVDANIEELEVLLTENAESVKQKEIIKRLSHIEGFKGLIEQRVKPISHKYEVCFGFLMGSISKHLICTSESVSKDVAAKLREIGQLKTLLILQNIKSNKKTTNIRSSLGKLGIPALDIVDFDKGLQNLQIFLGEYLKGKVVCDNTSQAYQIRDKRISGVQEIHTLDGTIIRGDGLVTSYGNTETLHKNYKYVSNSSVIYTDLAKYNQEKSKIQTELQMLSEKYNEQSLLHRNQELALVDKKKEELQQKLKQLLKPKAKNNIQVPKTLSSEIAELEKKKAKVVEGIKAIENKLQNSDYFNEFMKKHSIQSLESFRKEMEITFLEDAMKKKNSCNREINDLTAEINQTKEQIQHKVDLLEQEEDSVKKFIGLQPKEDIQAKLKQKHQQMLDIRQKISKITHFKASDLNFKSQTPQLKAKANYLKQRIDRYVEEETQRLGLNSDISLNFKLLQDYFNVSLERVQRRKIESVIQDFVAEQAEAEKYLEKYNTLQLFDNQEDEKKVQTQLKALSEELDELIEKRKAMYDRIEGVKQDRRNILMTFISTIKPILSQTYAILTEQADGTTGKVDIFVQNEEIPFESGMYFSPTPPSKRFIYDLQQLSGGEKSIASLALQYSLSLATKSYFLILDETDAFLDSANVDRFARLIQHSIRKSNIQFLLITHKLGLFVNSLSLVGVAKPKGAIGSQVYSLMLEDKMHMN